MTDVQEAALRRYREMAEKVRDAVPELPREIPMICYWDKMIGEYFPSRKDTIFLPTPEHMAYWHGESIESCASDHELLFLHELAHWGTLAEGHTPRMYAFMFCLAKFFGFKMMAVRAVELEYKPRAAKQGWRLYLRSGAA